MSGRTLAVGVDLGGTKTKFAILDSDGAVLHSMRANTHANEGREAVLARTASLTCELLSQVEGSYEDVVGVGVGIAGRVDSASGYAGMCPNFPGFIDAPVGGPLSEALGLPVRIANDAACAALGELHFGAGRGRRDVVLLTLGTGVGGAVIRDGRLDRGSRSVLGEIGHIVIDPNGPACGCGNHGCLESFCGKRAIEARARRELQRGRASSMLQAAGGDILEISPRIVAEAAREGDEVACDVLAETARYLAAGLVNAVMLCDPDVIILGGGVAGAGEPLWAPLRRAVETSCRIGRFESDRIVLAELGPEAGMVGAACLALFPDSISRVP